MAMPASFSSSEPPFGRITAVRGSSAHVSLTVTSTEAIPESRATVGRFVSIRCAGGTIIAMITEVAHENRRSTDEIRAAIGANVDFLGQLGDNGGQLRFQRGVTTYPAIGDTVDLTTQQELHTVYQPSGPARIHVGHLQQDASVGVHVDANEMLSKHFALVGSTGVGKSTGVSLLLNGILQAHPDLRVFLLDVHNEYGRCFGDYAQVLNPANLKLPFWLFNFEEFVDVLFGRRPGEPEELEILTEVIPIAKALYARYQQAGRSARLETPDVSFTLDAPVPYRLADLVAQIDERLGKLENRTSRIVYHKLISRIETVRNDPRYAFMFDNANLGGDTMAEVLSHLFRMPAYGKPMTVMQLAGFPVEVVDAVVSVLCRMAFDFGLWSDGASPLLFVCEEAHRYASADRSAGFGPTRKAVSRIAKEGRKYSVYIGLVTQRPAELDATIMSQCSTLFAMRLANDRDQALLRSAAPDAAANLLSFLPSLGTREVLAFGEGVALPTRLRFKDVPSHQLPRGEATLVGARLTSGAHDLDFIRNVVERWRGASSHRALKAEPFPGSSESHVSSPSLSPATLKPSLGLDPDRFQILKRPLR